MSRRTLFVCVLVTGVGLLAGCSATDHAAQRRALFVDSHPEIPELLAESILNEQIQVGMTQDMVAASWGKPARVEKAKEEGIETLWIYGNYFVGGAISKLYFDEDGVLVRYEIQDQQTHANSGPLAEPPRTDLQGNTTTGDLSKGPGNSP